MLKIAGLLYNFPHTFSSWRGFNGEVSKKRNYAKDLLYISFSFLIPAWSFSQTVLSPYPEAAVGNEMALYEDTLKHISNAIAKAKTDAERLQHNANMIDLFEQVLSKPTSFTYPFDSLRYVSRLTAPDNAFKIYNWNIEKSDGTYIYYGFIQSFNVKTKKCSLYQLSDKSAEIGKTPEFYTSDHRKWYGMLYYKIILTKDKKKKYYTLLGWDGNDRLSCKKMIDVLSFGKDGTPHFGDPIFNVDYFKDGQKITFEFCAGKMPKRIIYEYSAKAVMSLKYNQSLEAIVFDHLGPPDASLKGQYSFYGPDFSYDIFKWEKGKWQYVPDQIVKAKKDWKDKLYHDPKKDIKPTENKSSTEQKKK